MVSFRVFLGLGLGLALALAWGWGLVSANGVGQKQVLQSLHDIRLVENLFSPVPLNREAPIRHQGAGGKVFLTKRISWSD